MQKEKGISSSVGILIIIIIAIIAFGGVFAYQYFTPKTQPVVQTQQNQNTVNKAPIVEGISIEKPNLVVKGQNLSKVQIYFVPTGTGIDPETMSRIVDAVKQSENNGEQIWTYRYPSDLLITNIFAKGFDDKGNLVKEVDLPIVGATALADALYGNTTAQTAGWKTYTNVKYGFEIKYPADGWTLSVDTPSGNILHQMQIGANSTDSYDFVGSVQLYIQSGNVDSWLSNKATHTRETVYINGLRAEKFYFGRDPKTDTSLTYVFEKNNLVYVINTAVSTGNKYGISEADISQIISTFKFTK